MSHRQILRTRSNARQQVRGLLESIFVAELLEPSRRIYLVSAWVRDIELLDNRSGGFRGLDPTWGRRMLRLAEVLRVLVERGTELVVATRPEAINEQFVQRIIEPLGRIERTRVTPVSSETLHVKGLVGDRFALTGSMNFTHNGVENNDELLTYEVDADRIAALQVEFRAAYRGGGR